MREIIIYGKKEIRSEVYIERTLQFEQIKVDSASTFNGDIYTPHDRDTIIL